MSKGRKEKVKDWFKKHFSKKSDVVEEELTSESVSDKESLTEEEALERIIKIRDRQDELIKKAQAEVDATKEVLYKQIEKLLHRGEDIDALIAKAEALEDSAYEFKKTSKELADHYGTSTTEKIAIIGIAMYVCKKIYDFFFGNKQEVTVNVVMPTPAVVESVDNTKKESGVTSIEEDMDVMDDMMFSEGTDLIAFEG